MRVLLVANDPAISETLVPALLDRVALDVVGTIEDADAKLASELYEFVIVDDDLPSDRVRALLARVRYEQARCRRVVIASCRPQGRKLPPPYERCFLREYELEVLIEWVNEDNARTVRP